MNHKQHARLVLLLAMTAALALPACASADQDNEPPGRVTDAGTDAMNEGDPDAGPGCLVPDRWPCQDVSDCPGQSFCVRATCDFSGAEPPQKVCLYHLNKNCKNCEGP